MFTPGATKGRKWAMPEEAQAGIYSRHVRGVRETSGLTSEELAQITGVQRRQVQNWAAGTSRPADESRDRLLEVVYIVDILKDVYSTEGIEVWLHGRNRALEGERPLDLLRNGEFETVRAAVERLQVGAM